MIYHVIALQPRTPFKSYPQVVTVRTTAFEAAATTGGSASEEAAPAGEASTAGTSEFVGQVCLLFQQLKVFCNAAEEDLLNTSNSES